MSWGRTPFPCHSSLILPFLSIHVLLPQTPDQKEDQAKLWSSLVGPAGKGRASNDLAVFCRLQCDRQCYEIGRYNILSEAWTSAKDCVKMEWHSRSFRSILTTAATSPCVLLFLFHLENLNYFSTKYTDTLYLHSLPHLTYYYHTICTLDTAILVSFVHAKRVHNLPQRLNRCRCKCDTAKKFYMIVHRNHTPLCRSWCQLDDQTPAALLMQRQQFAAWLLKVECGRNSDSN